MSVLKIKDQNNNWTQIPTIKGEKGDPFTYADFTTEQLESLKGKDGISPTVSVASDTSDDYRLSFTDETHTVTTPNLIPEAEKILSVYPHDTASGAVASFPDGADNIPLKSCIVRVEPVQDLHGYDSPWPAGGGKNLFRTTAETTTVSGVTFTVNSDGSIKTTGTPTANISTFIFGKQTLPPGEYIANGFANGANSGTRMTVFNENTGTVLATIYKNNEVTFTLTEESVVRVYPIILTESYESGWTFYPMIRKSTEADATFAPYENICPITGWTGCEVQRTGKNLIPADIEYAGNYSHTNYIIREGIYRTFYFPVPKGMILYHTDTTKAAVQCGLTDEPLAVGVQIHGGLPNLTNYNNRLIDNTEGHKYLFVMTGNIDDGLTAMERIKEFGVSFIHQDYIPGVYTEPKPSATYPITFPTEAGTVYGGYIDPINGDIVAEYVRKRVNSDLGSVNFSTSRVRYTVSDAMPINSATSISDANIMCSHFHKVSTSSEAGCRYSYGDNYAVAFILFQKIDAFGIENTLDGWNAFLESNEVYVTYKLAEPIHYPLASIENIKTLLGTNNIWSDAGNVNVRYRADTELYIDKQIPDVPVDDVQINGTSIVDNGVANVPIATNNVLGTVRASAFNGTTMMGEILTISTANSSHIKDGTRIYNPITPVHQHESAFYGLAKAAGDTTQSSSSNAIGEYTDSAKTAIKNMLGVIDGGGTISETITGTDPTITAQNNFRYMCGELYTLNFTPCVSGVCEVIFTSGATPTVLTLPDTVRMPAWWTGVEANTTYEISIVDGVYGAVMSWS